MRESLIACCQTLKDCRSARSASAAARHAARLHVTSCVCFRDATPQHCGSVQMLWISGQICGSMRGRQITNWQGHLQARPNGKERTAGGVGSTLRDARALCAQRKFRCLTAWHTVCFSWVETSAVALVDGFAEWRALSMIGRPAAIHVNLPRAESTKP